jgi:hypothetical protein
MTIMQLDKHANGNAAIISGLSSGSCWKQDKERGLRGVREEYMSMYLCIVAFMGYNSLTRANF